MALKEDWAVVVGINSYPELGRLDGPENDAKAFHKWVTTAGKVPAKNARLILSSKFKAAKSATDAQPTADAVQREFYNLDDVAARNAAMGEEAIVGRRLYLFLAGHGFGPDLDSACLLMANATRNRTHNHIAGKPWANRFVAAGLFEEVVLFMDCCRESYNRVTQNIPDTPRSSRPGGGRRFYAFSAKYDLLSRERNIDGRIRGVFSAALLNGLETASEPDGRVTARSLSGYLYSSMKSFLTPDDLADPDIAKEPDLYIDPPTKAHEFVITTVKPKLFPLTVQLPAGVSGRIVEIVGAEFKVIDSKVAAGPSVSFNLPRSTYLVQIAGTPIRNVAEIEGVGPAHVDLSNG